MEDTSKSGSKAPRASKAEKKKTSPVEKLSSHKPSDQSPNLGSGSPPTETFSQIQVRPLAQLLKQETLGATKEKSFNQGQSDRQAPTSPSPAAASPSRLAIKPILRNRRRTVSCNQGISIANAGNPSRSEEEVNINKRLASLDKESLKYIINNSDTIYDEPLKLQARLRLGDKLRRERKAIELDQHKDSSPVKDLVEDEIVDAIHLPEQFLQKIDECFGIKISEGQSVGKSSEEIKKEVTNAKELEQNVPQARIAESCTEIISQKTAEKEDNSKSSKDLTNDTNIKGFSNNTNNANNTKVSTEILKDNHHSKNMRKGDGDKNKEVESSKIIKEQICQEAEATTRKTPSENTNLTKNKNPMKKDKKEEDPKSRTLENKSKHEAKSAESISNVSLNRVLPKPTKGPEVHRPPLLPTPPCGFISTIPFESHEVKKLSQGVNEILCVETSPETSANVYDTVYKQMLEPPEILDECSKNEEVASVKKNISPTRMDINRDSDSSPVIEIIVPENVIELLSSSDEGDNDMDEISMEEDEPEAETVDSPSSELEELSEPTPPTPAFNNFKDDRKVSTNSPNGSEAGMEVDSLEPDEEFEELRELAATASATNNLNDDGIATTDWQGISEYERKRLKLKLQSMADNVVDSFEKLILPNLRASLSESYSRKHSSSLQSRLHFISCVVTSSEHNSRTFSKIEVANIQRNLKAADNQQAMEFLIREIVSVVSLQKQRLRGQEESIQENGPGEVKETTNTSQMIESPVHRTPRNSPPPLVPFQAPGFPFPGHQSITPFPVGLPFLATDYTLHHIASSTASSFGYPLHGVALDSMELSDQVGQINEIDRRLLENQNRRTFLDEMIVKLQKEKSDLEMHSLELQTRRSMLRNSIIARSRPPTEAPPAPKTPPPSPPREAKRKSPKIITAKNAIAKRTRSNTQKPKALSKVRKLQKKRIPKTKSKDLKAQLQKEISEKAKRKTGSKEPQSVDESNAKARELEESKPKSTVDTPAIVKPKQSQVRKPKANGKTIPPLPPPPPPPEPIRRLSYDIPHRPDPSKRPPPPAEHYRKHNPHTNEFKVGNISKGKLHNVTSPITQIRIHKKYVIAASEDGDIYLFHLVTHKLERKITKHSDAITNMFLCEEESLLYTTSLDGFFKKSAVDVSNRN